MRTYSIPVSLGAPRHNVRFCVGVKFHRHANIRLSAILDFPAVLPGAAVQYASTRTIVEVGRGSSGRPASCLLWRGTIDALVRDPILVKKSIGRNSHIYISTALVEGVTPWWEDLGGLDLLDARADINLSLIDATTTADWHVTIRRQTL